MKPLLSYPWPGNIRELENLIERAVLLSPESIIHHIPLPEKILGNFAIVSDPKQSRPSKRWRSSPSRLSFCAAKARSPGQAARPNSSNYPTARSSPRSESWASARKNISNNRAYAVDIRRFSEIRRDATACVRGSALIYSHPAFGTGFGNSPVQ